MVEQAVVDIGVDQLADIQKQIPWVVVLAAVDISILLISSVV